MLSNNKNSKTFRTIADRNIGGLETYNCEISIASKRERDLLLIGFHSLQGHQYLSRFSISAHS